MTFYARAQKKNESKEAFADDLQILVHKIIARKPEFREDANEQLKSQFVHKLKDPYYAAIARSMLQSSEDTESFTQFRGHLAMMFGGRSKSGKTSSHAAAIETSSYVISEEAGECTCYQKIPGRGRGKLNNRPLKLAAWRHRTESWGSCWSLSSWWKLSPGQ